MLDNCHHVVQNVEKRPSSAILKKKTSLDQHHLRSLRLPLRLSFPAERAKEIDYFFPYQQNTCPGVRHGHYCAVRRLWSQCRCHDNSIVVLQPLIHLKRMTKPPNIGNVAVPHIARDIEGCLDCLAWLTELNSVYGDVWRPPNTIVSFRSTS